MERTLCVFTTVILSAGLARAAHPNRSVTLEGTPARETEILTTRPDRHGRVFARQMIAPVPIARAANARTSQRADTRIIYLNRTGATLRPGVNNSSLQTSSIVDTMTEITPWEIDDAMWDDTVACMTDMFAPFDVQVTDQDPGSAQHLEAVFGGHPADVGLPENVAGISPFTTDCSTIESSVVFTFTDVLPDDARLMCEVMAQEIAHSYGLDHQMLAADPMSYLDHDGDRTFQDEPSFCGEFELRTCGIGGNTCRATQNSVALLSERLGVAGAADGDPDDTDETGDRRPRVTGAGCATGASSSGLVPLALALLLLSRRVRVPPRAR